MSKDIIQKLRGTTDYYPPEMRARKALYEVFDQVYKSFGYEYYDAPILESFDLYASKSGDEIVKKQSYTFEDRGGRQVVLRPEMTPSLARMIATKQGALAFPLRWYTVANCWRYERPQKGRTRNFFQLNVDLVGSDSPLSDAEVLASAVDLMDGLTIPRNKYKVRVNDRALVKEILNDLGISEDLHGDILPVMDRVLKMQQEKWFSILAELGLSQEQSDGIKKFMSSEIDVSDSRYDRIREILEITKQQGYGDVVIFDPSIVRGLAYYTGMVFEVQDISGVYGRSLSGGGRYDGLLEAVGGQSVPAVGFASGVVGLETYLKELGIDRFTQEVDTVVVAPFSKKEEGFAQKVGKTLRGAGVHVDMVLPPYGVKAAFKRAERTGSNKVILVMPEEAKQENVVLKNLETSESQTVSLQKLADLLK